jgi:hypothetical protein
MATNVKDTEHHKKIHDTKKYPEYVRHVFSIPASYPIIDVYERNQDDLVRLLLSRLRQPCFKECRPLISMGLFLAELRRSKKKNTKRCHSKKKKARSRRKKKTNPRPSPAIVICLRCKAEGVDWCKLDWDIRQIINIPLVILTTGFMTPPPKKQPGMPLTLAARGSPKMGSSIGIDKDVNGDRKSFATGTIGGYVRLVGKKVYQGFLTCCHVVTDESTGDKNAFMTYPSIEDLKNQREDSEKGTKDFPDSVYCAKLGQVIAKRQATDQDGFLVDCAFIELQGSSAEYFLPNEVPVIDEIKHDRSARARRPRQVTGLGNLVGGRWYFKAGIMSGITSGTCNGASMQVFEGYKDTYYKTKCILPLNKLSTTDPEVMVEGDSGSLVIDGDGKVCGMLFAGVHNIGCVSSISSVRMALEKELNQHEDGNSMLGAHIELPT